MTGNQRIVLTSIYYRHNFSINLFNFYIMVRINKNSFKRIKQTRSLPFISVFSYLTARQIGAGAGDNRLVSSRWTTPDSRDGVDGASDAAARRILALVPTARVFMYQFATYERERERE